MRCEWLRYSPTTPKSSNAADAKCRLCATVQRELSIDIAPMISPRETMMNAAPSAPPTASDAAVRRASGLCAANCGFGAVILREARNLLFGADHERRHTSTA